MDELTDKFGALSTEAAEWKPSANSELNPTTVKEFVPGQAWAAQQEQKHQSEGYNHQQEEEQVSETTVPSGPTPGAPTFRGLHHNDDDHLWRYYRDLAMEATRQMDAQDPRHNAIPLPYCNAFCIESGRSSFGYPSSTFLVTNRQDGKLYCLKRFDNVRSVSPTISMAVTERWKRVTAHPCIATFYSCFVAQRAVFFVHEYIPGARSLQQTNNSLLLPEPIVWSVVTQIVAGLRAVHRASLAVRALDLQHILANVTFGSGAGQPQQRFRIHLGSLGIMDALEFEARKHVVDLQEDDIRDLGRLILYLTTGTADHKALLASRYSKDIQNLTLALLQQQPPSIMDVSRAVTRCCAFEELDEVYRSLDRSESVLAVEYNSARAFRLLLKMGFVNERPEFGPNRRWAQSGDCYVLTLFRDYVFHQADSSGNPVMDLGHVVTALNKLDAADEEKIVLSSRDGKSLMVVSYADVARSLESAFHELCGGAVAPSAFQF